MNKWTISLISVGVLGFGALAACGNDSNNGGTTVVNGGADGKGGGTSTGGAGGSAGSSDTGGSAGAGTAGSGNAGGSSGNGNGGSAGNGGASACNLDPVKQCFQCQVLTNPEHFLNQCTDSKCAPFDNVRVPK